MSAHVNRKQYLIIFVILGVLTVLELGVVKMPGIPRAAMFIALIFLAVSKAAIVGLYYMHLKWETKVLKLTIGIPLATPAFYALVLIAESVWRHLW